MSLFNYIKNLFLILIFIQILPFFIERIKKQYGQYIDHKTLVGIVTLKNDLHDSGPLINDLQNLFKNDTVKAILLKIDSPGGSAGAAEMVFREIESLKKEYPKPIISLVQNICTSGAYWIACATDYIIAPGTAMIGSIGVYFPYLFQLNDFIEQYKIKYASVKAGTYKAIADPFKALTPAEQVLLQSVLDDSYNQFTYAVATARKLPIASKNEWADGKIFTGQQALNLHLIDQLGSISTAKGVIKEKALIDGEIEWIYPESHTSFLQNILYGNQENETATTMNTKVLQMLCTIIQNKDILSAHL